MQGGKQAFWALIISIVFAALGSSTHHFRARKEAKQLKASGLFVQCEPSKDFVKRDRCCGVIDGAKYFMDENNKVLCPDDPEDDATAEAKTAEKEAAALAAAGNQNAASLNSISNEDADEKVHSLIFESISNADLGEDPSFTEVLMSNMTDKKHWKEQSMLKCGFTATELFEKRYKAWYNGDKQEEPSYKSTSLGKEWIDNPPNTLEKVFSAHTPGIEKPFKKRMVKFSVDGLDGHTFVLEAHNGMCTVLQSWHELFGLYNWLFGLNNEEDTEATTSNFDDEELAEYFPAKFKEAYKEAREKWGLGKKISCSEFNMADFINDMHGVDPLLSQPDLKFKYYNFEQRAYPSTTR